MCRNHMSVCVHTLYTPLHLHFIQILHEFTVGTLAGMGVMLSWLYTVYTPWWLHNHRNLSIARWSDICDLRTCPKWCRFRKGFQAIRRFICCAPTIVYTIYSTLGRSIPSIHDLDSIFTSVAYIRCRPPYHTIYITYTPSPASIRNGWNICYHEVFS